MKVVAIIQARTGSTRLPGKVLEDIAGHPMLTHVVERTSRSKTVDVVVVATTTLLADDAIADLCSEQSWNCFRGSPEGVLDRYYWAATAFEADIIVRITSDCPLIEPEIVDRTVNEFLFLYPEIDYSSNNRVSSFPRGLDVEVMTFLALERTWLDNDNPKWQEHVTAYIYNHLDRFRIHDTVSETDYSHLRWTVDTPEDLAFVRKIYDYFHNNKFNWTEVLDLLKVYPEWMGINKNIMQKEEEGRL